MATPRAAAYAAKSPMSNEFASGNADVAATLWAGDAPAAESSPLEGDARASVAVVGAGHMGSSLALHLAELGIDVALLEAREPGWGASGRHAGHVVPQWQTLKPAVAAFGERAERVLALHAEAGDLVYRLAESHGIDCDAAQTGHLTLAHNERAVAKVERLVREWSDRGAPMELLGREGAEEMVGSPRYFAAALNRSGGRINPLAFVRGLARAAARAGARVHTRSPVLQVERVAGDWRCRTPRGSVTSSWLAVCTNGYTGAAFPWLARAYRPVVGCGLALSPLPPSARSGVLPSGAVMMETSIGFHPTLIDGTGRLVAAVAPRPLRPGRSGPPAREFRRWLHRTFPRLRGAPLEVEAFWSGVMAWSPDRMPRVFMPAPGLLAPMCFSGRGAALATGLGKQLAEALRRDDLDHLALPISEPKPLLAPRAMDLLLRNFAIPALRLAERVGLG
jgi:glycine/D-amino acid oxidase-like deaminating enzyme